jgi:hypothetical protein
MNLTLMTRGYGFFPLVSIVSEIFFKNRAQIPHKKGNHDGIK